MKFSQCVASSALVLACSLQILVNARPATGFHTRVRRDWISDTCGPEGKAQMQQALNEAREMARNMVERTTDFRAYLQSVSDTNGHPPTKHTQAQYITGSYFFYMFGRMLWSVNGPDHHRNNAGEGLRYLDMVINVGNDLVTNVLNENAKIDYYCDDAWLTTADPFGQIAFGRGTYWDSRTVNNSNPKTLKWENLDKICRESKAAPGPTTLQGMVLSFTTDIDPKPVDVLMLCPKALNRWRQNPSLTQEKRKTYDLIQYQTLDSYAHTSSGITVIHELTHSSEILKRGRETLDPKVPAGTLVDGVPAPGGVPSPYEWWGVQAVASANNRENQKEAIAAAENVAYYIAGKSASSLQEEEPSPNEVVKTALYLDNAYWVKGYAQRLPTV